MSRILIVDDNLSNREVLADALREEHELLLASNGGEAMNLAFEQAPDLILLDVMMPGMSGIETLRVLKSQSETRNIPVIVVSALGLDTQIADSLNAGAVDHVVKPVSAVVVRARIHAALRSREESIAQRLERARARKAGANALAV